MSDDVMPLKIYKLHGTLETISSVTGICQVLLAMPFAMLYLSDDTSIIATVKMLKVQAQWKNIGAVNPTEAPTAVILTQK